MSDKYLFLDVDGVLNNRRYLMTREKQPYSPRHELCPKNLATLRYFARHTDDLNIVLSSSWREVPGLYAAVSSILKEYGIRLCGKTPKCSYSPGSTRGNEIQKWMDKHGVKKEQIVIFDDESDMGDLSDRLVQTSFNYGLQYEHILKARDLLYE